MSKNYEKRGFVLTDEIREKMSYYRNHIMKKGLRDIVKDLNMSHMTWQRLEKGTDTNASWDSWNEIYRLLSSANLLDTNNIDLMSPDRMREVLRQYHISGTVQHSAIGTNAVNISGTIAGTPSSDEKLLRIMGSDMCNSCKIKALKILLAKGTKDE